MGGWSLVSVGNILTKIRSYGYECNSRLNLSSCWMFCLHLLNVFSWFREIRNAHHPGYWNTGTKWLKLHRQHQQAMAATLSASQASGFVPWQSTPLAAKEPTRNSDICTRASPGSFAYGNGRRWVFAAGIVISKNVKKKIFFSQNNHISVASFGSKTVVPVMGDVVTAKITVINQRFAKCVIICIGKTCLNRPYR